MEISNASLEWTSDDVADFLAFLKTQSGQRLIPKLAESAPQLLPGGELNAVLIRSGELRGFTEAIKVLLSLSEVAPTPARGVEAYPPLEDDAAWDSPAPTTH